MNRPHLWFLYAKQRLLDQNNKSLWVPDLTCDFLHAKSVPIIRNTSLHGSQPSRVVFRCKTATYGPEKQVSMGPRLDLSFCTCTTMRLAPELLGSMGLSPHLWVLHAKQRLLDQCTSLYGCQTSPVVLCMQKSVICTRIKTLYGFQLSPVVLCTQNSDFRYRITSLCRWIDPTCGFCMQNSDFWTRITSLYGSKTSPVIFCLQNSVPNIRIISLNGS